MAERVELSALDVAYLVGKSGATRIRLEGFSGARINIDNGVAEVRAPLPLSVQTTRASLTPPLPPSSLLRPPRPQPQRLFF